MGTMNPSRTLASRFRTQRTDRVRLDETEVLSVFELHVDPPSRVEILVEECRHDVPQGLTLQVNGAHMTPIVADAATHAASVSRIELAADYALKPVEIAIAGEDRTLLSLWNFWLWDGADQAWTGNSGIVAEELPVPDGALRRVRLWCSDGLGNPSFDDMIAVVTMGPE